MQEYQLYIDGAFSNAEGGKTADSINPATEEPWARVARASRKDTQRAIAVYGAPERLRSDCGIGKGAA